MQQQQQQQQPHPGYITKEQAETMVTDKDTLVDAFTRNSYYMPRASEAFLTVKFLLGVRKKKYFLPMSEDINKKQCADPPP